MNPCRMYQQKSYRNLPIPRFGNIRPCIKIDLTCMKIMNRKYIGKISDALQYILDKTCTNIHRQQMWVDVVATDVR